MSVRRLPLAVALLLLASAALPAQDAAGAGGLRMKTSFEFELFSRTLTWDEGARSSRLLDPQGLAALEFQVAPGFDFALLGGYSLSNWNGLTFRGLPFSIDYEAGSIGGLVVGAGLRKALFASGFWSLDAEARFTAYLGSQASYPVSGLAVDGTADFKGTWMRVEAGPVLTYRGFELFSPYLGVSYDRIWGTMTLTETIGDLEGSEEKKVAGAGAVSIRFGTIYEPGSTFQLLLGGSVVPFQKVGGGLGLDYGGTVRAVLAF